jgi:hypothetical protein
MHAATGNDALDLVLDKHFTLYPKVQCYKMEFMVLCPQGCRNEWFWEVWLPKDLLCIQKSYNEDFKGEIKIMAYVKYMKLNTGDRIA